MDRRLFCTSILAATMFVGGSAFAQQEQPTGAGAGAGISGSTSGASGGVSAGTSGATSDQSGAGAQQAGAQFGQQAMEKDPDKLFLKAAAVDNMWEQQAAQLAMQKAQSQDVKQLAQKIMDDHQKAQQELQQTAQKVGVQLPQQLPQMAQERLQSLQQLQGDDFDKQFVSAIKANHAMAISKCSDVAKIAKNDDVKRYAQDQLPALQSHGQMAMNCASAQGLGTEMLNQAQPAGATIPPSGTSGGTSGTSGGTSGSSGTSGTPGSSGTSGGTSGQDTSR